MIRFEAWYLTKVRSSRRCHVCNSVVGKGICIAEAHAGVKFISKGRERTFAVKQNVCLHCLQLGVNPTSQVALQVLLKNMQWVITKMEQEQNGK